VRIIGNVIAWILAILLAVFFMYFGGIKLTSAPPMVDEFARIGFGQWLRYFVGTLEVSAAILVLIPKSRFGGAVLIAMVMLGATITNLSILHMPSTARLTAILLALALSLCWLRKPPSSNETDSLSQSASGEFTLRTLWIPGLVGLAAFHLLWTGTVAFHLPISFVNLGFVTIPIYWQLIFVMPLIGGLGAFLSGRLGGSRASRLAAGLFPALPMALGYPLARLAGRIVHIAENTAPPTLTHTTGPLLMAIAIAGLSGALLIGVLPFLRDTQKCSQVN